YRMVLGKYYRLLNCGFRLPVSAGTAAGVKPNPAGHNRVYVRLEEPLTYARYMAAFAAGRSFATNGPMLFLRVNAVEPGGTVQLSPGRTRVRAEVTVMAHQPLTRLNLVHNGRTITQVALADAVPLGEAWMWSGELTLDDHSGWLAAHVE